MLPPIEVEPETRFLGTGGDRYYQLPITYYRAFHVCEAESAIEL